MPINEQSKQEYLEARDVFVESYKDFLRKLLGLLDEAERTTGDASARQDVAHFADEVRVMEGHLLDFRNEDERAKAAAAAAAAAGTAAAAGAAGAAGRSASSEGIPRGASQDDPTGRASSPGEAAANEDARAAAAGGASRDESGPVVPLIGTGGVQSTTSSTSQLNQPQPQSQSKSKSQSQESVEELQAEVESQPSQLTASEEAEEAPQVFAPAATDDSRVVSAFCAFRYHKAEFRQLFMRQGTNNSAAAAATAFNSDAASAASQLESELADASISGNAPEWLGPLAEYTLHLMRAAFRSATPDQWEALKVQLAGYGFRAEAHFALWLRLSAVTSGCRPQHGAAATAADPSRVFNAIPSLASLPKRLAAETLLMLQTLNLLSE